MMSKKGRTIAVTINFFWIEDFMNKKHILDIILFLVILFVLIAGSSYIIKPKDYDTYDLSVVKLKTKALEKEEENTIDVVFAGNSESCYTFSPLQLWGDYGITSYDTGSGAQRLCDTYSILIETFKRQSPKIVFLEMDSAFEEYPGVYKDDNVFDNTVEKIFPIFHYHSAYNGIQLPQFILKYTNNRQNEKLYKGYQLRDTIDGFYDEPYVYGKDDNTLNTEAKEYLAKIKELCEENKCELILVSAPSAMSWSEEKYEAVNEWAKSNSVKYYDLNKDNEKVGIDWTNDTYDRGVHVNIYGSKKATAYIGEILKTDYSLTDHRTDTKYADWQKDYEKAGLY